LEDLEDVLVLGPQEYELDISQHLYEYAHLCIPARRAHLDVADCNQGVLKELQKYSVENDANSNWIELKDMQLEEPEALEDNNYEEE